MDTAPCVEIVVTATPSRKTLVKSNRMIRPDRLLRTKLAPPRLHRRVLTRHTLIAKLCESLDVRVTLVHAGTGYGKTTALAGFDPGCRRAWYNLDESDSDPQQFLSYLVEAFRLQWPDLSEAPLAMLDEISSESGQWSQVMDVLINALTDAIREPALLVVDDYHFVAHSAEVNMLLERFINYLPPGLHLVLASRHPFNLPDLVTWRAKGQVIEIGRRELAFQPIEIDELFRATYGMQLAPDEVAALADKTEGWPIALQLVWQGLRDQRANVAALLAQGPASLGALFEYLARDVLDRLPHDLATFLRQTAVLRELTPQA